MPDTRAQRRLLGPVSVLALIVLAAVALAIGANRGPATVAQRAAAVESRIRCPSCTDISVADSEAPSAIAARRQIQAMVRAGASAATIERSFVARYGPSILLAPPASGLDAVVWVVPAVGLAVALAVIGALFWRRARALGRLRGSP
jgi:cytochrome c-type biogenesis protein CcmH